MVSGVSPGRRTEQYLGNSVAKVGYTVFFLQNILHLMQENGLPLWRNVWFVRPIIGRFRLHNGIAKLHYGILKLHNTIFKLYNWIFELHYEKFRFD